MYSTIVWFNDGTFMTFIVLDDFEKWYDSRTSDEKAEFSVYGKLSYLKSDGCPYCNS